MISVLPEIDESTITTTYINTQKDKSKSKGMTEFFYFSIEIDASF